MAQLVKTTNDVIVNALYLLGELGVGRVQQATAGGLSVVVAHTP